MDAARAVSSACWVDCGRSTEALCANLPKLTSSTSLSGESCSAAVDFRQLRPFASLTVVTLLVRACRVLFVRPYLTRGTFREQFIYPDTDEQFRAAGKTDADLSSI